MNKPSEEVILVNILVKKLKLDLLTRKLGQNNLSHRKSNIRL